MGHQIWNFGFQIFKLRQGASIKTNVGRSVGRSVCLSVFKKKSKYDTAITAEAYWPIWPCWIGGSCIAKLCMVIINYEISRDILDKMNTPK